MKKALCSSLFLLLMLTMVPLSFSQIKKVELQFKCFIGERVVILPLTEDFVKRCVDAGGTPVFPDLDN